MSIGQLDAGTSGNIIPGEATMELNVRTVDDGVRETVLSSIRRIVNAEAMASGAPKPPTLTHLGRFPTTDNDPAAISAGNAVGLLSGPCA